MAVTAFAGHMDEQAIVFDCMDQLSQFKGAPKELIRRERELLNIADVVFAGGPKIGRDKIKYNANTHSYGCGVDMKHFGKARSSARKFPRTWPTSCPVPCSDFSAWSMSAWITNSWHRARGREPAGARRHHRPNDQG